MELRASHLRFLAALKRANRPQLYEMPPLLEIAISAGVKPATAGKFLAPMVAAGLISVTKLGCRVYRQAKITELGISKIGTDLDPRYLIRRRRRVFDDRENLEKILRPGPGGAKSQYGVEIQAMEKRPLKHLLAIAERCGSAYLAATDGEISAEEYNTLEERNIARDGRRTRRVT